MDSLLSVVNRVISRWGWIVPPLVLGLYVGRVLSEFVGPELVGAVAVTAAATGLAIIGLRKKPVKRTWPLLLLLLYVLYPDADLTAAFTTAAVSFTVALLALPPQFKPSSNLKNRLPHIAALLLAAGFILLYLATLSTGLLPADSGEFQLVGSTFGIAHPPGFPLYTMLANMLTHLPFGADPAAMVNVFSALTGTATLLLVYYSILRLTGSILGGLVGAVALGTATTFWAQSTTANVRSLTAMFAALAIYLLIRYREEKGGESEASLDEETPESSAPSSERANVLYVIAFVFVLVLGVSHHTSLVFMGLIFILFLFLVDRNWIRPARMWPWLLLAVLIGLLPLLYLPLRAASGAPGATEDLTTIGGFLNYVLALGFRGDFFYFTEPGVLWERLKVMGNILTFQFDVLILIIMGAGFLLTLARDRKLAFLLGGSFAIMALITAMYRAPQSVEYLMPAYVPLAILLGYAVGALQNRHHADGDGDSEPSRVRAAGSILVGILVVGVLMQGIDRLSSYTYLHELNRTREFTERLLDEAPVDSVILADWHWATPLWYLQEVEGKRPDVEVSFVFPTAEEYGATWARRIQEELAAGRAVVATHWDPDTFASLPPADPVDDAFLFGGPPALTLPANFVPLDIALDSSIRIVGYSIDDQEGEIGKEAVVTLAWRPTSLVDNALTLFVHMVGDDGRIIAQQDVPARAKEEGITFTQLRLVPRPGIAPAEYALLAGAYGAEPLKDAQGETRTLIGTLPVVASTTPLVTFNPANKKAVADSERTLIGYDWDNTLPDNPRLYLHWEGPDGYHAEVVDPEGNKHILNPVVGPWGVERNGVILTNDEDQHYIPFSQGIVWSGYSFEDTGPEAGRRLSLPQKLNSSYPLDRDLVVSLRLVGFEEDGFHWAWWDLDDGVPAMGAIPTLKWIGGSAVRDPKWLTVDENAPQGQVVSPLLRLYDAFTGRELPILDERISEMTPWLSLGRARVAN